MIALSRVRLRPRRWVILVKSKKNQILFANFGPKKSLDGILEATLQCSQHQKVVFQVSRHNLNI